MTLLLGIQSSECRQEDNAPVVYKSAFSFSIPITLSLFITSRIDESNITVSNFDKFKLKQQAMKLVVSEFYYLQSKHVVLVMFDSGLMTRLMEGDV